MNSRKYNFILLFVFSFAFSDYCKLCGYDVYNNQDLIYINQNGQDKIVHQACFRCSHCDVPIVGAYTEFPNNIFFHSVCPDGTAHNRCTGCYRNHGHHEIADKNIYCNACHSNIVDTKKEIEKYKKYVLGLLSDYGFNGLEDVSVGIVSPLKMSTMWNGAIIPEGLTLAFEDSAILSFFLGDKKNKIYIYILDINIDVS